MIKTKPKKTINRLVNNLYHRVSYVGGILWHETNGRLRLFELLLYERFREFACKTVAAVDP